MGYNVEVVARAKANAHKHATQHGHSYDNLWFAQSHYFLREAYQQSLREQRIAVPGYDT
jgi:hypothetical protein